MITALTKLNAVIGNPLGHSLSPEFHNAQYARRGLDTVMLAFPHENVEKLVDAIRTLGIGLTAVTIPHKENILEFLDEIDPLAKRIGAVNTIIQKGNKLHGFNTDYHGIAIALQDLKLNGKNVLLLGAGGAARPAAAYLADEKANVFCLNRSLERAQNLVDNFGGQAINSEDLSALSFDLIINATPIGMSPNVDETPLDEKYLNAKQVVFDFIYNPIETRLLREATAKGAKTLSGKIMFEAQALEQINLYIKNL